MKKHYLLVLILSIFAAVISSCNSSDEPTDNGPDKNYSSEISIAANQTSADIYFTCSTTWSAYVTQAPETKENVDWLHLNSCQGEPGDIVLAFTTDANTTGLPRTAYIVIEADNNIIVKITQQAENDPNLPDPESHGTVSAICTSYVPGPNGAQTDGVTRTTIEYHGGRPQLMTSQWRDYMTNSDEMYCDVVQTIKFQWNGNKVTVNFSDKNTYYPTNRVETDNISTHFAELIYGKAIEGHYQWAEDDTPTKWTAQYDDAGYLKTTKNNDGTSSWETMNFVWANDCLQSISSSNSSKITISYSNPELKNLHKQFDLNWILPNEMETYDFAAGDITRIFAGFGLMGKSSPLLITSISENNGNYNSSYIIEYSENTPTRTLVTVRDHSSPHDHYTVWEITYDNID